MYCITVSTVKSRVFHQYLRDGVSEGYLLVLISGDCGELRFREGEAVDSVSRQRPDL